MQMNYVEKAECLLDAGSLGNMNFTIIVAYRGDLTQKLLEAAFEFIQSEHQTLRTSLRWTDGDCSFSNTHASVPLRQLTYTDNSQWKMVAREDVRQKFQDEQLPLWRVSWLDGKNQGQLLITFHHAIADGVCGMALVDQLFSVLEQLKKGKNPQPLGFDGRGLRLESLNVLTDIDPEPEAAPEEREDKNYHTNFVLGELDSSATSRVISWAKANQVRLTAVLFAALLLAIRRVTKSTSPIIDASTVVNFRSFLSPMLPKGCMRLTRVCVITPVPINEFDDMANLAKFIHGDLHARLAAGEHIVNLKRIARRVQKQESAQSIWRRARVPDHLVILTNIGNLEFSGDYSELSIEKLFFIANIEPAFDSADNWILGANTFRHEMFLTLWYLEELVDESTAQQVLLEMKKILEGLQRIELER